jgi:hypothetical protein
VTPSKPRALRPARTCRLATLFALLLLALTATAAAAAPADDSAAVQSPTPAATDDQATATIASATDPTAATTGAVAAPAADDSASAPTITAATAPATPSQTTGNDIRPEPPVLAAGAADAPISRPARAAAAPRPTLNAPIISSSPRPPSVRATVTQLASGGPFVASSGHGGRTAAVRRGAPPRFGPRSYIALIAPRTVSAPIVAVAVPIVGVYVGSQAGTPRHIDAKPTAAMPPQIGPSGLGAVTLSPFGAAPGMATMPVQFGDAPFSSTGGSMPLLGLDTMLAAMMLLAGISWGRRSWELPVLKGESALLSSALDRPG